MGWIEPDHILQPMGRLDGVGVGVGGFGCGRGCGGWVSVGGNVL